jgi:hypothetical protein
MTDDSIVPITKMPPQRNKTVMIDEITQTMGIARVRFIRTAKVEGESKLLAEYQEEDDECKLIRIWTDKMDSDPQLKLLTKMERSCPAFKFFWKNRKCIYDEHGILQRMTNHGPQKFCPEAIRHEVLLGVHNKFSHAGEGKCLKLLQFRWVWPSMKQNLKDHLDSYKVCLLTKGPYKKLLQPMLSIGEPKFPNELVSFDIIAFPVSERGSVGVLVLKDHFSRYCIGISLYSHTSDEITEAIFVNWISKFGVPGRMHSDGEKGFVEGTMRAVTNRFKIAR